MWVERRPRSLSNKYDGDPILRVFYGVVLQAVCDVLWPQLQLLHSERIEACEFIIEYQDVLYDYAKPEQVEAFVAHTEQLLFQLINKQGDYCEDKL